MEVGGGGGPARGARPPAGGPPRPYRIATEATHNVVKHAEARRVRIALQRENGSLCLEVADDGRGFEPGRVPAARLGLRSMQERAESLGGAVGGALGRGRGTTVVARLPLA